MGGMVLCMKVNLQRWDCLHLVLFMKKVRLTSNNIRKEERIQKKRFHCFTNQDGTVQGEGQEFGGEEEDDDVASELHSATMNASASRPAKVKHKISGTPGPHEWLDDST
jgi:hypothetical protein